MFNVLVKEIKIDNNLKQKIEFICKFAHTKPIFVNGSMRIIDKTNLMYIEPHKIYIDNNLYLVFNNSDYIYINNFSKKIKISAFENYLKNL